MKKIVYIWKGPYPFEIRIQKICESSANNGYDVTVLCRWDKEAREEETINGVKIIRNGFNKDLRYYYPIPFNPLWKSFLKQKINEIKPDLIINREFFLMTETAPIARKLGIPIIMDMAENYPAAIKEFRNYNNSTLKKIIYHKIKLIDILEKHAIKHSNGIITVCQENSDRVIKRFSYPTTELQVVHNTPLSEWFDEKPIFRDTPKVLNYMGYVSKERNLENFIKGFDLYSKEINNELELHIFGSGTELEILKQETAKLANKDKVVFYGNYDHSNLCKFINAGDIGILPYINNYFISTTISNKMFDYMAMGKPVICTDVPPMRRIIDESKCGVYADCSTPEKCKDSIKLMIESYSKKMCDNGIAAFKNKYNWENDEKHLLNFIRKCINIRKYIND